MAARPGIRDLSSTEFNSICWTGEHVVAIDGSPVGGGRTATVLRAMAGTDALSVAGDGIGAVVDAVEQADAVVFGSPAYRASFAHPLKHLLDELPRGMWGETRAPLQGKAVCIVATGPACTTSSRSTTCAASSRGSSAAHVVPPGLYVPRDGFGGDGALAR
jgi:FMN reductase